jgi:hypothetical protein
MKLEQSSRVNVEDLWPISSDELLFAVFDDSFNSISSPLLLANKLKRNVGKKGKEKKGIGKTGLRKQGKPKKRP